MAIPIVKLRKVNRQNHVVFMLDYCINGKRIREVVGSKKNDAIVLQAQVQHDLTLGKYNQYLKIKKQISLSSLILEYKASKLNTISSSSLKRYENYLSSFNEFFQSYFPTSCHDIRGIKHIYIKECFDKLLKNNTITKKALSSGTINGLLIVLREMFSHAIKEGYIEENPANGLKKLRILKSQKIEYFTDTELSSIWKTIDPYWLDFLQFLLYTGLRKSELINLKWKNVSITDSHQQITITPTDGWVTKTRQTRVIALNNLAVEIIKKWAGKHPEYVFTQKDGKKIQLNDPYRVLLSALKKLKLSGDIHKFRHTAAAQLVMRGATLYEVGRFLGHSDPKSTQIYAHLSPEHMKTLVEKIS